ncbi:MAG: LLM class F420-dependent oxidoreductase [Thermomicrobiales bacterium]
MALKIGVTFPQTEFGNDRIAIRDYAQTAEGLGYTNFLAYDHVLSADTTNRRGWSGYSLADPFHEIFVLFGYIAAITENLELTSGVLILPQRQTALVAKQAAEVDILSGGRMRLGIGVGWNEVEYDGLQKSFRDRGKRSEEQIALLRALFTNDAPTFEGQWESVHEAGILPLPIQRPIPIWIGGYAEETIKRVARIGDGWFPWREPNDEMKAAIERLHGYAVEAGRDPQSIGLSPQLSLTRGNPDYWKSYVQGWEQLGATHLTLNTMGGGLKTPAEHIALLTEAAKELEVS